MQEKKKILFVITKGNFGGAQRYVYDLATNLPKKEFEAVVACGDQDGSLLQENLEKDGVRVIALQGSGREIKTSSDFKVLKQLISMMLAEDPQIVHLNSSKIGFLGALAGFYIRITKIFRKNSFEFKVIFTSHGWAFNEQNRGIIWKIVYWLAYYLTIILCHKVITVSEKTKGDVSFMPFIKNKLVVIHNGISNFKLKQKQEARTFLANENDKGKKIIFSAGELHNSKGFDTALKAISNLDDKVKNKIIYCIAGKGEEKENLEALATELGISKEIRFLGFIPNSKEILSGTDIFLSASRNENLPYAILEAGLAGLPIISTCVGGVPEVIRDMQNGILVHPKNPKEITEAIIYLLNHKDKQKEFGKEIRKTVLENFSIEKMVRETLQIYSEVL